MESRSRSFQVSTRSRRLQVLVTSVLSWNFEYCKDMAEEIFCNSVSFSMLYLQVRNNHNQSMSEKCQKFEKNQLRSRVAQSEAKYPTLPKFPTPTPDSDLSKISDFDSNIKGLKFGCENQCKSWYTARNLCFNKGFKEIVPFQQEFPILECDVKNDPIGHPWSESDKTIRLRLPVLLGIQLRLHSKTSDSLRLRLRLRNPA